ncbi:MAG: hypothetical protein ACW97P_12085, partial [Candidatus Hodarchaeales archaeon]
MKKQLKILSLICILTVCLFVTIRPASAYWIHTYRYLDDSASTGSSTARWWGGRAYTRDGDMDNLGMYAATNGLFDRAWAFQYVDGGDSGNSPWTFSTESYRMKVFWRITGTFDYGSGAGTMFAFEYSLYHFVGTTKVTDKEWENSYTFDFEYNNQLISHYGGIVSLSSGTTYYLECTIVLKHQDFYSSHHSDMY